LKSGQEGTNSMYEYTKTPIQRSMTEFNQNRKPSQSRKAQNHTTNKSGLVGGATMAEEEQKETATWDEATTNQNYVKLKGGEEKKILITDWKLEKTTDRFNAKNEEPIVEFTTTVLNEDGKALPEPKTFTTTSNRLKKGLREVLEAKDPSETVYLSVMKVGEQFNTQYSVKEVAGEQPPVA